MPRILVSNIDNESMMADERALTPDFCRASAITARRMAWFAEAGDIVVLPRDLSPQMKVYIARTMGYEPGSVTYLTPDWGNGHPRPIRAHELLHTGLAERMVRMIGDPGNWSVYPYCYERSTQQFAERLGLDGERDVRPFVKQGGAELLNDKRVFRSVAAGRGVSIAEGVVCATQWQLEESIGALIDKTGAVIIKQDRHSGGFGNLIVSRAEATGALGAPEVLVAKDESQIRDQSRIAWARLAYTDRAPLIVEVYYPVSACVTAEFKVDAADNAVTFLNCGEVRQAPILSGLIMPSAVPPYQLASFVSGATELARLCCDLGYEGLVNIDGIVTADGNVIVNEFNGRIGGCSHIHHILEAVAGPRYGDTLVVVSHSRTVDISIDQAFGVLNERKLAFDRSQGRGIIVTGEDASGSGHLEYLSIAPSREDAMRLEAEFEGLLGFDMPSQTEAGIGHLAKILAHLPQIRRKEVEQALQDGQRHGIAHQP
ncbi:preATP grasp domain-containing protein [Dongia deserti]|uniref:preATP grasp domain-containing protein n=1 Tax=Dongia deserti TaxID=2268030 RepID=UPI000E656806|nr:peptide ligase PGM1-related protein [Dongia deserti]